ncbi:MAG: hypothetical protein ACYCZY_02955 [Lacisediminihabitans sp.]
MSTEPKPGTGTQSPVEGIVADDAKATRGGFGWLGPTIAILFGIFYVYDLWEAISNLVQLPATYTTYGLDQARLPWAALIIGLLIPPVSYGLAFWIGLRQKAMAKALVFLAGLAAAGALTLSVEALARVTGA